MDEKTKTNIALAVIGCSFIIVLFMLTVFCRSGVQDNRDGTLEIRNQLEGAVRTQMIDENGSRIAVFSGNRHLIIRKKFEEFMSKSSEI